MSPETSPQPRRLDPISHLRRHPQSRKVVIWGSAVAIVVAALLVALPYVAAHYAEAWLRDNGASSASIADVDINPFAGVVRVSDLQASGSARERLHIGTAELHIRWWPLVSRRIHVQSLQLADAQVDLVAAETGAWQLGAVTIQPAKQAADSEAGEPQVDAAEAAPWEFGSEAIHLSNTQLTYRDALFDTAVDIRELRVSRQYTWDAQRSTELIMDLSIDGSPLVLSSDVTPWAERRQLSGTLKLSDLNLAEYRPVLQQLAGLGDARGTLTLDLQVNATYDADGALELLISGPLQIRNASLAVDDMAIANDALRWQGDVGFKLPAPKQRSLLQADGNLQLAGTRTELADLELAAELNSLDWNGTMEFSPASSADAAMQLALRSALTGSGFKLNHSRLPFVLAALDEINATDVVVNGTQQSSAQQLQLEGLRLLADHPDAATQKPDVLNIEQLELNGLRFDAQRGLSAESLALRGPQASLVRNEEGEFERIAAVMAVFTDSERAATAAEPSARPKIAIADVQLRAEALLSFEDRSVTPAASLKLSTTDLTINNLHSDSDKPMDVHLTTGDGNMTFTADGTANVFADRLSAELDTRLAALELPQVSAYLRDYNIERGRLNADSHLVIKDNTVDMHNALLVEKLKLSAKSKDGDAAPAQAMGMPVDVALDLLRDGDDRIELDLPVSGSMADPQFGTGNIMRQAIQNALKNAAMTYVTNALQPLGMILLIRNTAAKSARPRFVPVEMAPGDASLSGTGREYLQKLGALLSERPGLQLTICGVATPADREMLTSAAMANVTSEVVSAPPAAPPAVAGGASSEVPAVSDEELLQLAVLRTSAVIGFLVDEENIEQARLFGCRETIEASDDQGPRAEISL